MITAVNKATGQGLEVVGPANRFGAGLRPHGSSATPISVSAATAAPPYERTDADDRADVSSSFSFPPCFLFLYLCTTNKRADRVNARGRAVGVPSCGSDLGEPPPVALVGAYGAVAAATMDLLRGLLVSVDSETPKQQDVISHPHFREGKQTRPKQLVKKVRTRKKNPPIDKRASGNDQPTPQRLRLSVEMTNESVRRTRDDRKWKRAKVK